MTNQLIPQTINSRGVITATDDAGLSKEAALKFLTEPQKA